MPEVVNSTAIYCKSDCEFSQNEQRLCSLKDIQLTQKTPDSAEFVCSQYVRAYGRTTPDISKETDIERSRTMELKRAYAARTRSAGWR